MFATEQFCGILTLVILFVSSLVASTKLIHDPDTSACLDKINEYLDTFGMSSEKLEGSQKRKIEMGEFLSVQVITALDQAIHHLNQPLVTGESLGSIFRPMNPSNRCSRRQLKATVVGIREAFDNCDQVSLDYLMIVANYRLTSGDEVLINKLARNRLELCWQRFVSGVSRQLDRVMGKMTEPVFKNLEQIAEIMIEIKRGSTKSAQAHTRDTIHIDEQKARDRARAESEKKLMGEDQTSLDLMEKRPANFLAIIVAIRGMDFEDDEKIRQFSRAILKLLKKQQAVIIKDKRERHQLVHDFLSRFFSEPCQELVIRVRSIVALGEIYRRHIEQTLGQALADEKRSNPRLSYELEVYRVCKLGLVKTNKIIEFMERAL